MIDAIAERVWPGRVEAVEPLGGGITNHNYKVVAGGEAFVVRIGGADTALLGVDRTVERIASENAAALGIAPEVVAFLEPERYLVTRYVEGEAGRPDPGGAAQLLRRLHDGPPIAGRFDSFRVVRDYATLARQRGVSMPDAYDRAAALAELIEPRRRSAPLRPCHNDLLAANFVDDGSRLWLVDWEYAGMGDPAFDLANFAAGQMLDEDGDRALLTAYGSGGDPDVHVLMRFMSDFREAMWGVLQQAVSELDFDFAGYAAECFDRLEATVAGPAFRRALTAGTGA